MYIKCIGERERERDSLLIRTRHRLGYRLGVYRRCMESGTNTVGNVPSLRMMDDRGRLYRQTIWKSRYGGGSNSIWWNGESKAARREGEVFANGPVLRNVRLLEGWFCLMKLLLEIIIFLWIEIELVFFFFSLLDDYFWAHCIHWFYIECELCVISIFILFRFSCNSYFFRKWDRSKKDGGCVKWASAFLLTR